MGTVTFVDETTSGGRSAGWGIEVAEERLSVGELIRRRVFQEVAEYNARTPEVFQGLVQPKDAERVLNGYAMRTRRRIDPEAQTELALAAFAGNGFLVLVGDRQVTDLEEEVELPLGSEVVFLKLVPLVGG
ncbi:hypothetical protein [Streptomyces bluensis]|uniref:hypothetical protein n=1 Tax=Streptomyces bluensis TaxID=33897 RepID=UPI00167AFCCF|nr:hypothetical protein [Streptomyces bluensis]GGZ57189.1 hypothetical protein GCM10010344_24040 [Streptomyces bluensis]